MSGWEAEWIPLVTKACCLCAWHHILSTKKHNKWLSLCLKPLIFRAKTRVCSELGLMCPRAATSELGSSYGRASAGGFLAQAGVNFLSKASLHSLTHPFKHGSLPREFKKHHQLKQDAKTLALLYIFLADVSPEHHPRIGLLIVTGQQPWGRKWDVLFGTGTDLKMNTHHCQNPSLAENTAHSKWKKSHFQKKSPDAFHSVSAGKKTTFLSFCISCMMLWV